MDIKWKPGREEVISLNENKGVTYLTYRSLEQVPGLIHAFSTRLGGVSEGVNAAMNFRFSRDENKDHVRENYRRFSDAVGFDVKDLVISDQTHTANVRRVTEEDRGYGFTRENVFRDVDGMITNTPGLVLVIFTADCVPLYFVDPVKRAIGLSHSGWRGTAGQIGAVTVQKMHEEFGTNPKDIIAAIGPSICQDCYEVSSDVIEEFQKVFPKERWKDIFYAKENGKYQLDLWEANRQILMDAGIPEDHISLPHLCTCCNPELLFSHRASKGRRGNLGAFLGFTDVGK